MLSALAVRLRLELLTANTTASAPDTVTLSPVPAMATVAPFVMLTVRLAFDWSKFRI